MDRQREGYGVESCSVKFRSWGKEVGSEEEGEPFAAKRSQERLFNRRVGGWTET